LAVTACFPDDAKNAILGFAISDVLKDVIQSDTLIKQSLYDQFEKSGLHSMGLIHYLKTFNYRKASASRRDLSLSNL
jgi:hypothetical protein